MSDWAEGKDVLWLRAEVERLKAINADLTHMLWKYERELPGWHARHQEQLANMRLEIAALERQVLKDADRKRRMHEREEAKIQHLRDVADIHRLSADEALDACIRELETGAYDQGWKKDR